MNEGEAGSEARNEADRGGRRGRGGVLQKAEVLVSRGNSQGIVRRLRSIFSKVPIRNIEG